VEQQGNARPCADRSNTDPSALVLSTTVGKFARRAKARLLVAGALALAALSTVALVPQWSAAGERALSRSRALIVFTADNQLYSIRANGSQLRRLTRGFQWADWPSWSPDGRTIAFAGKRRSDASAEIYSMRWDGTELRRLTANALADFDPVWSPDGSALAFVEYMPHPGVYVNGAMDVMLMKPDGNGVRRIIHQVSNVSGLTWSPDGRELAFTASGAVGGPFGVRIVDVETGASRGVGPWYSSGPAWSPNGKFLAFFAADSLIVSSTDGTTTRTLVSAGLNELGGSASWSPDGKLIAFSRGRAESVAIFRIRADGTGLQAITHPAKRYRIDAPPAWSPDGSQIAFLRFAAGIKDGRLAIAGADGSHLRIFRRPVINFPMSGPQWQPVVPGLPFSVVDSGDGYPASGAPFGVELFAHGESVDVSVLMWAPTPGYGVRIRRLSVEKAPRGSKRVWCVTADRVGPGSAFQVLSEPFQTVRVERRLVGSYVPRDWVLRGSDRNLIGASDRSLRDAC
jgi:Tol biopolymer transport system component